MDIHMDEKAIKSEMKELLEYLKDTFKSRMKCQVFQDSNGLYSSVNLIASSDNSVYNSIYSSTSILKFNENSNSTGYEKKILNEIQKLDDEEKWILNIFFYIQNLPERECHYVIAKYFVCEDDTKIMKDMGIRKRVLDKIKSNALLHLGLFIPGALKLKDGME